MGSLLLPCPVGDCFLREPDERVEGAGEGGVVRVATRVDPLDSSRGREANTNSPGGGRGVERMNGGGAGWRRTGEGLGQLRGGMEAPLQ